MKILTRQQHIRFSLLLLILISGCTKDKTFNPDELKSECLTGISAIHKVLFIGIDGCRTDALLATHSSSLDSLMSHAYVNLHCDRGPYTVSAPGWSTLLHGVFPAKHGVTSNNFPTTNYSQYPDLFYYLRKSNPDFSLAEVSNWDNFLLITSNENYAQYVSTDAQVKEKALYLLNSCTPDVLLLHFDNVDYTGHQSGFSPTNPNYINAIRETGNYISEIMGAVELREQNYGEQWLVFVVTDHGGNGTSHGGQDALEETRFVFEIARLPNQTRIDVPVSNNTDVMPTILKYMSVSIDSAWGLDGAALF